VLPRRSFLAGLLALSLQPAGAEEEDIPWKRLREGGVVLLMRHGSTGEGLGDPPGFRLDDCSTQRNLSEAGRAESRRVGEALRRGGVRIAKAYTSPWCRCRETATLAFGEAEDWAPLSSFFDLPDREAEYIESVRKRIAGYVKKPPHGVVAMVTHNVNIAALTRHSVGPAELVLVRPDGCCSMRPMQRFKLSHSSSPDCSHFS
jgi:broad specificity phosphatase PhoE